jgi:putative spermidine/putrescine transport system ATP-binding protein
MLELRNILKTYNNFSLSINLTVENGETLVLFGPSGCGKSTVLNIITGLVEPEAGIVLIDGEDITQVPTYKRNIALVFQDLALFPTMDVERNIGYALAIRGFSKRERASRVGELLDLVRLPKSFAKRRIATLSGGEKQRVAIARALAFPPRALLMDEPFSSLDRGLKEELWRDFNELRGKVPCIFVSHDKDEAHAIGNRIHFIGTKTLSTTCQK